VNSDIMKKSKHEQFCEQYKSFYRF